MSLSGIAGRVRPARCPHCGAGPVAEILYGIPAFDERLQRELDAGRVTLGGCCVSDVMLRWCCGACSYEWGALAWGGDEGQATHVQVRSWIVDALTNHPALLAIALRQRAKFEGWLKFELAAQAEAHGATSVEVEPPQADPTGTDRSRADLRFDLGSVTYHVELKTPNANWQIPGVRSATRPITVNIKGIIDDAHKLLASADHGIVAFVLFPIPAGNGDWRTYLQRISEQISIPLRPKEHTTRVTIPLEEASTAEAVVCCFETKRATRKRGPTTE